MFSLTLTVGGEMRMHALLNVYATHFMLPVQNGNILPANAMQEDIASELCHQRLHHKLWPGVCGRLTVLLLTISLFFLS